MTTLMKRGKRNELSPLENRMLTPWNNNFLRPWTNRLFSSSFDDLNSLLRFDDVFKDDFFADDSMMPAMNVKEHAQDFEIELAIPGFNKKDFEVTIEEDVLHISGEKEIETDRRIIKDKIAKLKNPVDVTLKKFSSSFSERWFLIVSLN